MDKAHPAQKLREAKAALEKDKTYENAVELQRAQRQHRDYRKQNIKIVKGEADASGL